jgi:hypothetical protein
MPFIEAEVPLKSPICGLERIFDPRMEKPLKTHLNAISGEKHF